MKSIRAASMLLATIVSGGIALAEESAVVPPSNAVGGLSQSEWSRVWWQWAGSFQSEDSPIADRTGEFCGSKQSGPVWFLAGTYGTQRTLRSCSVPQGKYLFFPLINYVVMPTTRQSTDCLSMMSTAASITDKPIFLLLEIDGVRVEGLVAHRQATSQCFDMDAKTEERIRIFPSAANGYYVMIKPLPPGEHVLNFGGALPSMLQAVTYTLRVK